MQNVVCHVFCNGIIVVPRKGASRASRACAVCYDKDFLFGKERHKNTQQEITQVQSLEGKGIWRGIWKFGRFPSSGSRGVLLLSPEFHTEFFEYFRILNSTAPSFRIPEVFSRRPTRSPLQKSYSKVHFRIPEVLWTLRQWFQLLRTTKNRLCHGVK